MSFSVGFSLLIPGPDGDKLQTFVILDDEGKTLIKHVVPLAIHIAFPHPEHSSMYLCLSKNGRLSCLYDDAFSRAAPRTFEPTPGHLFYGHGFFTKEESFVVTEREEKGAMGKLVVRNIKDLTVTRELSFPYLGPHDCVNFGDSLAVAFDGIKPGPEGTGRVRVHEALVAWIDLATGSVQRTAKLNADNRGLGHLVRAGDRLFGLLFEDQIDKGKETALIAMENGAEFTPLSGPPELLKDQVYENLSGAYDAARKTVIAVSPNGNAVSLWDSVRGKFLRHVNVNSPVGVLVRADNYLVLTGHMIHKLDPETLAVRESISLGIAGNFVAHAH